MSLPGLAILYGGLVKKKWALNSAVMCFYAFSIVLIVWMLWGYNIAFGSPAQFGPGILSNLVGIPHPALGADAMLGRATIPLAASGMPPLRFPGAAMIYFQFVFAAITPLLIAGSVLGRMNFKAWMIFVPVWSTFVYSVGAFMIWGGGWLAQLGAVDYSGGYVIHLAAGVSGFVAAAVVGPRLAEDRKDFEPNNLIMAFAGAGILWLGWNGFNGGDPYFANADAAAAVLNDEHRDRARDAVLARPRHVRDRETQCGFDDQRNDHGSSRDHAGRRLRRRLRCHGDRRRRRLPLLGQPQPSRAVLVHEEGRRHVRRVSYARRRRSRRRPAWSASSATRR